MRIEIARLRKQAERGRENARKPIGIAAYEVAALLAESAVDRPSTLRRDILDAANGIPDSEAFHPVRWPDRPVRVLEATGINFGVDLLRHTPEEQARKREEFGIVRTATEEKIVLRGAT
jgi:hypothetical protein